MRTEVLGWPSVKHLVHTLIETSLHAIIACFALKQAYRDYLSESNAHIAFVYLKGSDAVIRERLVRRQAHFVKEDLLISQLSVFEESESALTLDLALTSRSIVEGIKSRLKL